jgi:uncharacterized protein DUF5989
LGEFNETKIQNQREEIYMGTFIKELWAFLGSRKKRWIAPVLTLIIVIAGLLLVAQGSVIAPFIYSLF